MINPVFIRSFCTLVELKHFTQTAQRLNMTQSGVSQHITKLEDQLGTALIIRHGKQFTVTEAGQQLYREGKHVIEALSTIATKVGHDPSHEGLVKIASPGSIGLKLYRDLLSLQKHYPKLVIDYRFAPNESVEKMLIAGDIDIGFMTNLSTSAEIDSNAVAKEALCLVTPASLTEPSWENLQALGFIDHPDGAHHANLLLSANYSEFHSIKQFSVSGFSNQISLILEPVALGLGFTVLPSYAVKAFDSQQKIKIHHLGKTVEETLYLCTTRNTVLANRVTTVINEATRCLS